MCGGRESEDCERGLEEEKNGRSDGIETKGRKRNVEYGKVKGRIRVDKYR